MLKNSMKHFLLARHVLLLCLLTFSCFQQAWAEHSEYPLLTPEEFQAQWEMVNYPDLITTEDGVPLFRFNVTAVIDMYIEPNGEFGEMRVVSIEPAGQGYGKAILKALQQVKLKAKTEHPTAPAFIRNEIQLRSF